MRDSHPPGDARQWSVSATLVRTSPRGRNPTQTEPCTKPPPERVAAGTDRCIQRSRADPWHPPRWDAASQTEMLSTALPSYRGKRSPWRLCRRSGRPPITVGRPTAGSQRVAEWIFPNGTGQNPAMWRPRPETPTTSPETSPVIAGL